MMLFASNLIPASWIAGACCAPFWRSGWGTRGPRAPPPSIGQVLAVILGFLGLFGNPLLVLVAVFIFLAASGEAGYVQAREYTRYLAAYAHDHLLQVA